MGGLVHSIGLQAPISTRQARALGTACYTARVMRHVWVGGMSRDIRGTSLSLVALWQYGQDMCNTFAVSIVQVPTRCMDGLRIVLCS